jgi:hypothetical protein
MLRVSSLFALAFGFLCLTAFRAEKPKCNDRLFPINTTQALSHFGNERFSLSFIAPNNRPDTDTLYSSPWPSGRWPSLISI